jgi:hypothetical protein
MGLPKNRLSLHNNWFLRVYRPQAKTYVFPHFFLLFFKFVARRVAQEFVKAGSLELAESSFERAQEVADKVRQTKEVLRVKILKLQNTY